jgi:predicted small secreted protein
MKHFKLTLIVAAAVGFVFSTSCATTRGFGQDLQKVGNKLENEADATGGAVPVQSSAPSTGIYTPPASSGTPAAY